MPKSGFKSLPIPIEIYDWWEKTYKKNEKSLARKGITSFSGYITSRLYLVMNEE